MDHTETAGQLVSLTATEMAAEIRRGNLTSSELVEAHIRQIESVDGELNALVVPLFEQARSAAESADRAIREQRQVGPLHGVPVTIKEFFDVEGTLTTAGVESSQHVVAKTDAPLVERLRSAGAIILGKTNVPQLGIAIETDNPVFGRTNNPWDLERSSGGSSGGESALIAAGGSPLGLGSDGGGSIRIPAHCCGLCGIMPTQNRLTMRGHWMLPSFPPGWSQPGPLARSVDDLELALRCLVARGGEPADPRVAPGEIGPAAQIDLSQLRVGMYSDDSFLPPSPAVRRAVEASADALRQAGAEIIPFDPPNTLDAWEINVGFLYADGGKWIKKCLRKSRIDPRIKKTLLAASLPTTAKRTLPVILDQIGQKSMASILRSSRHRRASAFAFQSTLLKQEVFREAFLQRLQEHKIDALLCPPFPTVAMRHNSADIVMALAYTFVYNLLGMPAGVVPVTTVMAGEESDRPKSQDTAIRELLRAEADSAGMPVGVQVVARHWHEDVALAIMRYLRESVCGKADFPTTPKLRRARETG